MRVIGFDLGYGWVKVYSSNTEGIDVSRYFFSSINSVATPISSVTSNVGVRSIVRQDNPFTDLLFQRERQQIFAVGDGVSNYSARIASEDFSLNRSTGVISRFLDAVLSVESIKYGEHDFTVVWTVPLTLKKQEQGNIYRAAVVGNEHVVNVFTSSKSDAITTKFQVTNMSIIEQAVSALSDLKYTIKDGKILYQDPFFTRSNFSIAIIDIGSNTIDAIYIRGKNIEQKDMISNSGVAVLLKSIQDTVREKGYVLSFATIQKEFLINHNPYIRKFHDGKLETIDFTEDVEKARKVAFGSVIAPYINKFLSALNSEVGVGRIYLVGGGVYVFEDLLKQSFDIGNSIFIPKDSVFCNARGAWKLSYALYKSSLRG